MTDAYAIEWLTERGLPHEPRKYLVETAYQSTTPDTDKARHWPTCVDAIEVMATLPEHVMKQVQVSPVKVSSP